MLFRAILPLFSHFFFVQLSIVSSSKRVFLSSFITFQEPIFLILLFCSSRCQFPLLPFTFTGELNLHKLYSEGLFYLSPTSLFYCRSCSSMQNAAADVEGRCCQWVSQTSTSLTWFSSWLEVQAVRGLSIRRKKMERRRPKKQKVKIDKQKWQLSFLLAQHFFSYFFNFYCKWLLLCFFCGN